MRIEELNTYHKHTNGILLNKVDAIGYAVLQEVQLFLAHAITHLYEA